MRLMVAAMLIVGVQTSDDREVLADRVMLLTRNSPWQRVATVKMSFRTYHPQGMVKVGNHLFVSSVEVRVPTKRFPQAVGGYDRDAGQGIAHLFKIDMSGHLIADLTLGEGAVYHPGGIDYDGTHIWVPVAEYRPDSRSIVYRVDPESLTAARMLTFADHLGAVVHNTDDHTLHGVSWGSRRFYRWTLDDRGLVSNADVSPASIRTLNPSHYIDYQDCKYAGRRRMLCTGVAEIQPPAGSAPFPLGGLELIDLRDGRPLHQVPVLLWTAGGLDMTHNPAWLEPSDAGIRAYFLPEDDASTLYIYEVPTRMKN